MKRQQNQMQTNWIMEIIIYTITTKTTEKNKINNMKLVHLRIGINEINREREKLWKQNNNKIQEKQI